MRTRTTSGAFGAASDDPVALADRALEEAAEAIRGSDGVGLREAAEKGWLAACSTADVVAMKLRRGKPKGRKGREDALAALEDCGGLRTGSFGKRFTYARVLHGECFHEDDCPPDHVVVELLKDVCEFAKDVLPVAERCRVRARRR